MKMSFILVLTTIFLISPVNVFCQEKPTKNKQNAQSSQIKNDSPLSFLPKGTIIHKRTKDKIYVFLPHNTKIQGLLCRGDKHQGWETVFYTNGKLALAWLAKPAVIQGIPCAAASFWTELFGGTAAVTFHPDGKLAGCKLAKDVTIDGHTFKKGDYVRFDSKGKLILKK
ncbi:hypothetical protein TTHT_0405 [Thermotomaculum hydrothermale]|uniref:Uncharacterized protein n=1 Tax=Thermotomaculum hydrothermale TaxID=981385 RepID=A0A7R6PYL2_9BACT|nr:hypothetical protein [Thermotomaculum hydrothermale]BBB32008.1 hypothetical protein TTHT_0405 [Thermotomaculum hydrothermale]